MASNFSFHVERSLFYEKLYWSIFELSREWGYGENF